MLEFSGHPIRFINTPGKKVFTTATADKATKFISRDEACDAAKRAGMTAFKVRLARATRKSTDKDIVDEISCTLHNLGATLSGNTQGSDLEWFAKWLYGSSNFGMGDVKTMEWSLSNAEFEEFGLAPDRQWTGKRWEMLSEAQRAAWTKLARLCLYALPHIAERIGIRFMEQAKGLRMAR